MKKILLIGLVLAMVLAMVLPTSVMAAKPASYDATGYFTSIDEGKVKPLAFDPNDPTVVTMWKVKNRHIQGEFIPSGEPRSLEGPFTITYDAIVDANQAGDFTGKLKAKSVNLKIQGTSSGIAGFDPNLGVLINLEGTWSKDSKAAGTFTGFFYFVPTADGQHIDFLTYSSFTLTQTR